MANKVTEKKTLLITHPHLLTDWHPTKNGDLSPENVTHGSKKKIWWECAEGHEWETHVYSRTGKVPSGCPYCAKEKFKESKQNFRPLYEDSIANLFPKLSEEWDVEKNGERGSETYTPGSNQKVWWKCYEGHEWDAVISDRTKTGCPYCSGQRVSKEKSFGAMHSHLVKEWHPEKNNDKTPYDYMPSTHQKAWFLCEHGHEWKAYIANRSKGKGCPYCSGHKATDETSLLGVNPELCKEWDYDKNDKDPNEYKPFSNDKVWWNCAKGHEWEATIASRNDGRGCPKCSSNSKTSFPEQAIFYYLKQVLPEIENRKKLPFLENNMEADIFVESLNLAIEYDGYYHMFEQERDERKNKLMQENNVQLVRIRQFVGDRKLPVLESEGVYTLEHNYNDKNGLNQCVEELFTYIKKRYDVEIPELTINDNKDRGEILKQMDENERNLEALFPHLVEEWHPTLNGTLLPRQIAPFTHLKVWWKCTKNETHVWDAKVSNRANGRTCPYCLNRKINDSNSLLTLSPELAKQWHPTKNGDVGPNQVALNYSKKVWWLCEEGHEWERSPNGRVSKKNGFNCPNCFKERKKNSKN